MQKILIVGGTGKTGRRITRRLKAADQAVRSACRAGGDIAFDLADPATWAPALQGVTAAYVVEPNLQASGAGRSSSAHGTKAGARRPPTSWLPVGRMWSWSRWT
ncbi:hypothetical protein [Amycolatopsis sp. NPDC004169]|uniref:hypothetical protein n=1 Tax=Amycolatopsis sp. NPDC004169 TaxID=3154453 RepID=UPI0033A37152